MQGPADVSGRAVYLDFPRLGQQTNAGQGTVGRTGGSRQSAAQSVDDAIPAPEGIQFDQAGVYENIYKAYGDLKSYLVNMRAKGIDPLKGPDPNIPESFGVANEWNRAVSTYMQLLQRSQQGLQNLDYVMKATAEGKMHAGAGILNGDTGVLSQEEVIQNTTPGDPRWLSSDVELLRENPTSQEDYDQMIEYRDGRIAEMEERVKNGSMTQEQYQYYLSKLPMPTAYNDADDRLTDAKIATERSRQAKNYRKDDSGGDGGPSRLQPELEELAIIMNDIRDGKAVSVSQIKTLGRGFYGDMDVPLASVRDVNGDMELRFVAPASLGDQAKAADIIAKKRGEIILNPGKKAQIEAEIEAFKNKTADLEIKIYVTEENLAGGLRATMTDAQWRETIGSLRDMGMSGNQMTLDGIRRFFGQSQPVGEDEGEQNGAALAPGKFSKSGSTGQSTTTQSRKGSTPGL